MKSLVYHAGALGDFVTILPALSCWRQSHLGEQIILWGRPPHGQLAMAASLVDEVRDIAKAEFARCFSEKLDEELSAALREFNSALLFTRPDSLLARNLSLAGIRDIRLQPPFPDRPVPVVSYHLSLLEPFEAPQNPEDPCLDFRHRLLEKTGGPIFLPARVLFHPGSGSPAKNWPSENFVYLAEEIKRKGIEIGWLAGPAEENWPSPFSDPLLRCPDLVELARVLAGASLFVGNDSGTSHLAAAMGCPTVAIFLDSDPIVWAPQGKKVRVIDLRTTREGNSKATRYSILETCLTMLAEIDRGG